MDNSHSLTWCSYSQKKRSKDQSSKYREFTSYILGWSILPQWFCHVVPDDPVWGSIPTPERRLGCLGRTSSVSPAGRRLYSSEGLFPTQPAVKQLFNFYVSNTGLKLYQLCVKISPTTSVPAAVSWSRQTQSHAWGALFFKTTFSTEDVPKYTVPNRRQDSGVPCKM